MEQPTEVTKVEAKPLIRSGERGLKLTTFDEMWRYSAMVATSDFCPKEFKGKPADCMIAIQYGMELGLSIMSSVRSIAVINGKPSIYGDALLAVCKGSPVFDHAVFAETESGKGDEWGWTCCVGRIGGRPSSRRFTVADARTAKLWGKTGPWTFYPGRMLQMRARAFALRDCFADLLSGVISREEAQDYPTPAPSGSTTTPGEAVTTLAAATAAMTLPEPAIEQVDMSAGVEHIKDAAARVAKNLAGGVADTPQEKPESDTTPVAESVGAPPADSTGVETMELLQLRHNVKKAFGSLPAAKQKKLLGNCSMKAIDDVDGIESAAELQQIRDAIISV